jgi:methionyl-tRNA formyltransferase
MRESRGKAGRVMFVGAVHEAVPALRVLLDSDAEVIEVVTLLAERAGGTAGFVDLEPLASAGGIPVRRVANINSAESIDHARRLRPDLIVVTGWTRLLSSELLAVPRRGCVGFHASLLPRHRGRAPVNWAILRGETETGNTMMFLDAGADTGDIIDQRPVRIEPSDTCATVYDKVGAAGADMLRRQLPALLDGTAPRRPQRHDGEAPLPKRTPAMGITNWNRPARAVHDWVRALTEPYPGAFTFLDDTQVMLWSSAVPPATEPNGAGSKEEPNDAGVTPEPQKPAPSSASSATGSALSSATSSASELSPPTPASPAEPRSPASVSADELGAAAAAPGEILDIGPDGVRVATASGSLLVTAMSEAGSPPEPATAWAARTGLRPGARFRPVPPATALWALGLGPTP